MSDPRLLPFLDAVQSLGIDALTVEIGERVASGDGEWLRPGDPRCGSRPATHMHELTLYGVTAHGHDTADAVNNWLIIARRILGVAA